eukprot:14252992-Heterocapsa_arctica.AAC.1
MDWSLARCEENKENRRRKTRQIRRSGHTSLEWQNDYEIYTSFGPQVDRSQHRLGKEENNT